MEVNKFRDGEKKRNRDRTKFSRYDQDYKSFDFWRKLTSSNTYTVYKSTDFKSYLPERFIEKSNYVVVMEKDISGSSVFVANFNRIDPTSTGSYIDQHPYIVTFSHNDFVCKGGFIDHGNWPERTVEYFDPDLWDIVSGSGLLNYLPIAQIPEKLSGNLDDLGVPSQNAAFISSLDELLKK